MSRTRHRSRSTSPSRKRRPTRRPTARRSRKFSLARALGVPDVHTFTSAFARLPEPTLPHLKHVVIHGFAPPAGGSPSSRDDAWDGFVDDLQSLNGMCRQDDGPRVLALGRPWRRDARWAERLRCDWIDRIGGGRGCWVMTVEEEEEHEVVLLL